MNKIIKVADLEIHLFKKNIKNMYLNILPPHGTIRVSVPKRIGDHAIESFIMSKLNWIKKHQHHFANQERVSPREYLTNEIHHFMGKSYTLTVKETHGKQRVEEKNNELLLYVLPNSTTLKRERVLENWYRKEMEVVVNKLIAKQEKIIGVQSSALQIRKMKRRWGSCHTISKKIILNLELIKKPTECLEYVLVHELIHLLEPSHNKNFYRLMDEFFPNWKTTRTQLNEFPLGI